MTIVVFLQLLLVFVRHHLWEINGLMSNSIGSAITDSNMASLELLAPQILEYIAMRSPSCLSMRASHFWDSDVRKKCAVRD